MIEIDGKIYRNLEEQVRKNKEDIESIDTNVTSNTNAINDINTRLDNLDLTYATDKDIQNLQSQINTKANQSALDSTNTQVSTNTSNISSLNTTKANQSDLNSTNSRVSTLESTVTQLSPQVAKSLKTPMSAPSSTELVAIDTSNGQAMISIGAGLVIENDTLKSTGGVQIIDNLTSTSISAALSANQGRVLNTSILTKANQSDLDNLETTVSTKANQSDLDSTNANVTSNSNQIGTLATEVANKANQSSLNTTNSQVSTNTSNIASLNTNKANVDLSNVTYPQVIANGVAQTGDGDRVVESWISSDGLTWYRKWASGWKECGLYLSATDWKENLIVLPVTFSTDTYTTSISFETTMTQKDFAMNEFSLVGKTVNTISLIYGTIQGKALYKSVYCCGY